MNQKWTKHAIEFGPRLKAIRDRQGLSLGKVADAAGVSRSYLHELENSKGEKRSPSVFVAYDLATALGVSLETLIGLEDEPAGTPTTAALELVELKRRLVRIEGICKGVNFE